MRLLFGCSIIGLRRNAAAKLRKKFLQLSVRATGYIFRAFNQIGIFQNVLRGI